MEVHLDLEVGVVELVPNVVRDAIGQSCRRGKVKISEAVSWYDFDLHLHLHLHSDFDFDLH
jgi:hypothetical protein